MQHIAKYWKKIVGSVVGVGILVAGSLLVFGGTSHQPELQVLLPLDHTFITGRQTLQVRLKPEAHQDNYRVSWEVDGGVRSGVMGQSSSGYIDTIEIDDWNWRKDNTYTIVFSVEENGEVVASAERVVYTIDTTVFADRYQAQEEERLAQQDVSAPVRHQATQKSTVSVSSNIPTEPVVAGAATVYTPTVEIAWVTSEHKDWVTQDLVVMLPEDLRSQYIVFWSAEGGHKNEVTKRDAEGNPVVSINFSGWWWKGNGPYPLALIIQDASGQEILSEGFEFVRGDANEVRFDNLTTNLALASQPVVVPEAVVPVATEAESSPSTSASPVTMPSTPIPQTASASLDPWRLRKLTSGDKPAIEADLAAARSEQNFTVTQALEYILAQPQSTWLNGNSYDWTLMSSAFERAKTERSTPVFVLYNIPQRDCGLYSSGGASDYVRYKEWIDEVTAATVWDAVFVVEPDALAMLNCLSEEAQTARLDAIKYAVTKLSARPNVYVYVDAGHAFWVSPTEMAERLKKVNVAAARGFALNTSNYVTSADSVRYGDRLAGLLGGKGYVIDSSRNGLGQHSGYEWCNPGGRGLGRVPTLYFSGYFDAELWIKTPGESDGYCNGGPNAGTWWREYAVGLYQNRVQ